MRADQKYPEKLVCITGTGQSAVGRPSDRSPLRLTIDACRAAVAHAGLSLADIDGLSTYPGAYMINNGFSPVGANEATVALGISPTWVGASVEGHSHIGAFINGINAIAAGLCRHVLVFRTVGEASARARLRHATVLGAGAGARVSGSQAWQLPYKVYSMANIQGLYAQAYFDKYGATSRQLGAIAVNSRSMATLNPNAIYRTPITIEDYLAAREISSPLRLYDCDTHIDGSTAIVLSHRDAARDLPNKPIEIEAMGMSVGTLAAGWYQGDFTSFAADRAGEMLWSRTDLKPGDVDAAQLYDGFSTFTLLWLEALQLCGRGEAAAFVEGGSRIGLDGELPLNTGGGQLSAGRFHGFGHTFEACQQLWGRAGARQVKDARVCIVANGGVSFGTLLLKT